MCATRGREAILTAILLGCLVVSSRAVALESVGVVAETKPSCQNLLSIEDVGVLHNPVEPENLFVPSDLLRVSREINSEFQVPYLSRLAWNNNLDRLLRMFWVIPCFRQTLINSEHFRFVPYRNDSRWTIAKNLVQEFERKRGKGHSRSDNLHLDNNPSALAQHQGLSVPIRSFGNAFDFHRFVSDSDQGIYGYDSSNYPYSRQYPSRENFWKYYFVPIARLLSPFIILLGAFLQYKRGVGVLSSAVRWRRMAPGIAFIVIGWILMIDPMRW